MRFRVDGWEDTTDLRTPTNVKSCPKCQDVMGIEEEVIVGMRENWPILEEALIYHAWRICQSVGQLGQHTVL